MRQNQDSYSDNKQSVRDYLFFKLARKFDKRKEINVLTFPGKAGLVNKNSFENQLLNHFPNAQLICLEQDRKHFETIKKYQNNKRIILNETDDKCFSSIPAKSLDFVWLDYFGTYTTKVKESLDKLFLRRILSDSSMLALTLCVQGRAKSLSLEYERLRQASKGQSEEFGINNLYRQRVKMLGYEMNFNSCVSYKNNDESNYCMPMKTMLFDFNGFLASKRNKLKAIIKQAA